MLKRIVTVLFIGLLLVGCKSKKTVVGKKPRIKTERPIIANKKEPTIKVPATVTDESKIDNLPSNASYAEILNAYIDTYKDIAMQQMQEYGIPASITLSQGILESGAGRGELTRKANNHFGIKCHTTWTGETVTHDDDEKGECFRKYKDPKFSYRDHSLFLTQRSRYQDLFKLKKDDYKAWAKGLKKAGYATDPKYPDKLISIIEKNNLTRFDALVLGDKFSDNDLTENTANTYTVQKGDTLYSIAKRYDLTVEQLKQYNRLRSNDISIGQILYLQSLKN